MLSVKEHRLELEAAPSLTQNGSQAAVVPPARISLRELEIWKLQAKAIGRSTRHLDQIDKVLQSAVKGEVVKQHVMVEIPWRDYEYMLFDQAEFSRRAFELME